MAELSILTQHLGALLQQVEPKERRKLATEIGRELRKKQAQRIDKQKNPDGSGYVPRKNKLRTKKGRVRQQMFLRIKNAKYLRLQNTSERIAIGFFGRIENTARVHQFGLRDRPNRYGGDVRYAKRELLGFAADDLSWIEDKVLAHLKIDL